MALSPVILLVLTPRGWVSFHSSHPSILTNIQRHGGGAPPIYRHVGNVRLGIQEQEALLTEFEEIATKMGEPDADFDKLLEEQVRDYEEPKRCVQERIACRRPVVEPFTIL